MNGDDHDLAPVQAQNGEDDLPPRFCSLTVRRRRRWRYWLVGTLLVLLALLYFPMSILLYSRRDDTRPADAAIVLGAAVYRAAPSPVFRERIRHGIYLYQNGTVHKLVFTGGLAEGDDLAESEAARDMAIAEGVPERDILIETSSTTTWLNFRYAKVAMADAGIDTVLVVSDPIHMKRAMTMAHDIGLKAWASPTPTSLYKSFDSRLTFLRHETWYYFTHLFRRTFRLLQ